MAPSKPHSEGCVESIPSAVSQNPGVAFSLGCNENDSLLSGIFPLAPGSREDEASQQELDFFLEHAASGRRGCRYRVVLPCAFVRTRSVLSSTHFIFLGLASETRETIDPGGRSAGFRRLIHYLLPAPSFRLPWARGGKQTFQS